MSNPDFIAGPWSATKDCWNSGSPCDPDMAWNIVAENGWCVCEVWSDLEDDTQSAATARLIAAAPDLLAALSRLVKTLDKATGDKCPDIAEQPTSPLGQARAAVAKARGKE